MTALFAATLDDPEALVTLLRMDGYEALAWSRRWRVVAAFAAAILAEQTQPRPHGRIRSPHGGAKCCHAGALSRISRSLSTGLLKAGPVGSIRATVPARKTKPKDPTISNRALP
jgi:hypothetical protein